MGATRRDVVFGLGAGTMALFSFGTGAADSDRYARQRARMVQEIDAMARRTASQTGRMQFSEAVMAAMGKVPRHRFVPAEELDAAYLNQPLPIGNGQTISQPYIVALSADLVDPQPSHRVLEIGTGAGYQAAVLAEVVSQVYSVEIVERLAREAEERLRVLGYGNVSVRYGDGHAGWPEAAPFDAIVVTAAAPRMPTTLIDQLKRGGRMVVPVGAPFAAQELRLIEKAMDGTVSERVVLPVVFVPMTGGT